MRSLRQSQALRCRRTPQQVTKRPSGAQLAANLNFDFPQVVRQHTLGVVAWQNILYGFCLQITPLFDGERILNIDQVLTKLSPSVGWSTFLELDGLPSTVMPPTAVTFDLLT